MRAKSWTKEEKKILIDSYPLTGSENSKAEFYKLCRLLGRSHSSLRKQARQLGLCERRGPRVWRAWESAELDLIEKRAGVVPIRVLMDELKVLWAASMLPPRSRHSVAGQISYLGAKLTASPLDGEWFTVSAIADALRCKSSLVRQWISSKELNKVLKAMPNGEKEAPYIIKRQNLRRFFIAYPGLLEPLRPNMNWLIDIVAGTLSGRDLNRTTSKEG